MSVPVAELAYNADSLPVLARGLIYTDDQVDEMLYGMVKSILQDTSGKEELQQLLSGVVSTDFEQVGLEELLTDDTVPDNWRVGEAIAECFVADMGNCHFPWPTGRDLKNPNASPAGCDLTGFQPADDEDLPFRFAFGEVKTSEQEQYPPSVMYSLGGQLRGLRDNRKVKDFLCLYLGHHAVRADWEHMYISSAKRYLQSNTEDVAVYGVLVRDVTTAQAADISGCATDLASACPAQTDIEIYALYLPQNTIATLSDRAVAAIGSEAAQ